MRKLVYLAIAMLLPGSLLAEPIKKDAAKAKAAAFLQQKMTATNGRRAPQNLSLESNEPEGAAYYVFKNGTKGFAIVAGDDRFGDVIGYSEENSFDEANMPEALRLTLQDYAAVVKFAQENNIEVKKGPRKAPRADVAPFMEYTWDQGLPYCNLTPEASNSKGHCSLGCMAVTVSMIVAHYRYPGNRESNVTLPGHTNGSNNLRSEARTYDVTSFKQKYEKSPYSSTYPDPGELDDFMYHIANLLDTKYEAGGSSATESRFLPTMKDYLGYNANMRSVMRDAYSAEEWEELIYNEIAAGRPVNFLGSHPDLGGHAYLCDGYRASDGFFHMIWGWGSTAVGYFDMNVLNPFVQYLSSWGQMGYDCPPAGFTSGLKAILGIQPETIPGNDIQNLSTEDITKEGNSRIRATIRNWDDRTFSGQLSWAILNEDNTFTKIDAAPVENLRESYYANIIKYLDINSLGLIDGYYKVVPICKTNDEGAEWILCEGYQQKYAEVNISGGNMTIIPHPVKDVTAEMVTYKGYTGIYLELLLKLKNNGDDVFGYLTVTGTRDDGVEVYGSKMDVAVKGGQTELLSLFIENGGTSSFDYYGHTYEVTIKYMNNDIGTFTIDPGKYAPSSNYFGYESVDFEDYEYVNGNAYLYNTTLKGNVNISCSSSSGYYAPVKLTLKDENMNVVYEKTTVYNYSGKETKAYPIEATGLLAGKKYYLTAQLVNIERTSGTYNEKVVKSFFSDFPINVTIGVPYYKEDGTLDRQVITDTETKVNLPANTAAVDFRTFSFEQVNLSSIKNENCLFIFPAGATVPAELSGKNVVVGGVAEKITLADGKPVVFPVDFTATEITYARTFTNYNNGGTGGWNTIVLPFEATPTLDGANIDWFHSKSDASGRKFWLYKYTNGVGGTVYFDYASEHKMQANVPYLLAVPGDKWGEKYDLHNKEFVFRGENAAVKANVEPATKSGEYVFNGTFAVADCKNAYKLNEAGDFFELQTEDAAEQPFRAYFANADESTSNAARVLRVARSETDGIVNMENVDMTTENEPVYNLNGQRMQQLQRGVNIVGGKKILKK